MFETDLTFRGVPALMGSLCVVSHHDSVRDLPPADLELAIWVQLAMHNARQALAYDCIDYIGYDC